jgi:steroid 5-alpha reductase family enzyme
MATAAHLAFLGAIMAGVLMFALWLLYLKLNNASVVDPGWALGLALLGSLYAILGSGYPPRRGLIAGMSVIWGLRLALHLTRRIWGEPEEGRYQQLRREWGRNIKAKFFIFFEFQALLDLVLSLPFLLAVMNAQPRLHRLEYLGVAVWILAIVGEAEADIQLAAFKRDPANHGKVCQIGLWNYSRHPNYFFEWLVWIAWALFALASPWGWLSFVCPALMLYFLYRVTGIPATEAQALRSKGDAYRQYQATTSAFVPWFKNQPAGEKTA